MVSEHGAKIAAGRIGITVDEYRRHEAAGERWCSTCASWLPVGEFPPTARYCRSCKRMYEYSRRQQNGGISYAGPAFSRAAVSTARGGA